MKKKIIIVFVLLVLILIIGIFIIFLSQKDVSLRASGFSEKITVSGVTNPDDEGIYLLNWKIRKLDRLTPKGVTARDPIWSQNGNCLAFRFFSDESRGIGVLDLSTNTTVFYQFEIKEWLNEYAWLNDDQILLLSWFQMEGFWNEPRFYILHLSNGTFTRLDLNLGKFQNKYPVHFAVSENNDFVIEIEGEIYKVNLIDFEMDYLTKGNYPFFSPDGDWITFICSYGTFCKFSLAERIVEGIPINKDINLYCNDNTYSWSLDGRFIIFRECTGESDPTYISVLNANSGRVYHIYKGIWSDGISLHDPISSPYKVWQNY